MISKHMVCDKCTFSSFDIVLVVAEPTENLEWVSKMTINCKKCGRMAFELMYMQDGKMKLNDKIWVYSDND